MTRYLLLGASAALLLPASVRANIIAVPLGNGSVILRPAPITPTPSPTPEPFPSPVFTPVPSPVPAPVATTAPQPTPRATPSPSSTPAARTTPTAPRTSTRATTSEPDADQAPRVTATPRPAPTPTVTPAPIETVVLPQALPATPRWPWLAGGAALLLGLAALLLRRRGRGADEEEAWNEAEAEAAPPPLPVALPLEQPGRLGITLRPSRAGLNLLTATVEAEVEIVNIGDMTASDIRAAVTLLGEGAGGNADVALDAVAALPVTRPAISPFALAPGEARRFRAVAALPHHQIQPLTVSGRPMFVPLVGVTVQWRDAATARCTTQGFAVGVERVDSAKLAPLWLDVPSRTYDNVAARPHGAPRER